MAGERKSPLIAADVAHITEYLRAQPRLHYIGPRPGIDEPPIRIVYPDDWDEVARSLDDAATLP